MQEKPESEGRLIAEWQCTSLNVQFLLLQKRQENIGRRAADSSTTIYIKSELKEL